MSGPAVQFIAVLWAILEPRFPVASGAVSLEHDGRGEAQKFGLQPEQRVDTIGPPNHGCNRPLTASAKSRRVRKTERVCSRPWEVGFVARFGITSCSPNLFKMRFLEHHNMTPIKQLLQSVETQKSVDLDTVVAAKRQRAIIPSVCVRDGGMACLSHRISVSSEAVRSGCEYGATSSRA